jgi:hypothetical protein
MKVKSRKQMSKRSNLIKKHNKERQALLREQKRTLPLVRRETPKFFSKIGEKVNSVEGEVFRNMTFDRLQRIMQLNKISINSYKSWQKLDAFIAQMTKEMQEKLKRELGSYVDEKEVEYLINRQMMFYFSSKTATFDTLRRMYCPNLRDKGLPAIASHDLINTSSKVKSKHIRKPDGDIQVIEGMNSWDSDIIQVSID